MVLFILGQLSAALETKEYIIVINNIASFTGPPGHDLYAMRYIDTYKENQDKNANLNRKLNEIIQVSK